MDLGQGAEGEVVPASLGASQGWEWEAGRHLVSRLPSASGSRWMSAATGDWPGWPPVKVAKRPEQQGLERDNRAGPHGITDGDLECLPRAGDGEAEDGLIALTEGTRSLGFPVNHPWSAWVCLIITEI